MAVSPTCLVCLNLYATKATKCCVSDVEEQIKKATAKHVTKKQYITSKACVVCYFGGFQC